MTKLKDRFNRIVGFASRPMVIFYAISLYAVLGFGWWIFYNINASNKHFENSVKMLESVYEDHNLDKQEVKGSTGYDIALEGKGEKQFDGLGSWTDFHPDFDLGCV